MKTKLNLRGSRRYMLVAACGFAVAGVFLQACGKDSSVAINGNALVAPPPSEGPARMSYRIGAAGPRVPSENPEEMKFDATALVACDAYKAADKFPGALSVVFHDKATPEGSAFQVLGYGFDADGLDASWKGAGRSPIAPVERKNRYVRSSLQVRHRSTDGTSKIDLQNDLDANASCRIVHVSVVSPKDNQKWISGRFRCDVASTDKKNFTTTGDFTCPLRSVEGRPSGEKIEEVATHKIEVNIAGEGKISAAPDVLKCTGATCSAFVEDGQDLKLIAEPKANHQVVWPDQTDAANRNAPQRGLHKISQDRKFDVRFEAKPIRLSVVMTGDPYALVSSQPEGLRFDMQNGAMQATFPYGTTVKLTVQDALGKKVVHSVGPLEESTTISINVKKTEIDFNKKIQLFNGPKAYDCHQGGKDNCPPLDLKAFDDLLPKKK